MSYELGMDQIKILIVDPKPEDVSAFEEMLGSVVAHGGELLFAHTTQAGLEMLKQQRPSLIFLDATLVGADQDQWVQGEAHIVLVRHRDEPHQEGEDYLLRPLKASAVLAKCHEALDLKAYAPPIPPM